MTRTGTLRRGDVRIGIAAEEVGVAVSTIRRWRRLGLLPFTIRRTIVGGYAFSATEIAQLRTFVAHRHEDLTKRT